MKYYAYYKSPVGEMVMVSENEYLTELHFTKSIKLNIDKIIGQINEYKQLDIADGRFASTKVWLDAYFNGEIPASLPPIKLSGTPFRLAVWKILQKIPYGETLTYKAIAVMAAKESGIDKMSAQAVGGAVGSNPVSIIVPCHRVIGSDGSLTGYASGIDIKAKLLEIEKGKGV